MKVFLMSLFFTSSIVFSKGFTGYDLYRSLNKKNSIKQSEFHQYEAVTAYIIGAVNALQYSRDIYENVILGNLNDKKLKNRNFGLYIMPFKKEWDPNQFVEIVHFYLKNNPDQLYLSAVEIISLSLFEASLINSLNL